MFNLNGDGTFVNWMKIDANACVFKCAHGNLYGQNIAHC